MKEKSYSNSKDISIMRFTLHPALFLLKFIKFHSILLRVEKLQCCYDGIRNMNENECVICETQSLNSDYFWVGVSVCERTLLFSRPFGNCY